MTSDRWPRDSYRAALWGSRLRPLERLVALAYAEHAREADHAWVTYARLREVTGMSEDAITRAIKGLRAAGWLELKEPARQHRSARYWLTIPPGQHPVARGAEDLQHPATPQTGSSSTLPPGALNFPSAPGDAPSTLSPEPSTPADRDDQSSHHSTDQSSTRARAVPAEHRAAVVELVARLAPDITEADAADCVAWVARRKRPDNLAGYVSRFPAEDVVAKAALWRGDRAEPTPDPTKCPHGTHNGMEVLGRGANASRRCDRCEHDDPADTAETHPVSVRRSVDDERASA